MVDNTNNSAPKNQTTANDNQEPTDTAISLTDLAALSGIDEDTLLRRLATILQKRSDD